MKHDWILSQEAFDDLLDWLDSDREQAGIKYEDIRRRLIKIFTGRACVEAEDLADETINRVTSRLSEIKEEFRGDRARYFFGVANKVYMEHMRRKQPQPPPPSTTDSHQVELEYRCLEGSAKVDRRKQLAEELGIAPNALRIRAYRIRLALQDCVEKCIERSEE
jgi:DNA-directed RNA polymerase specialized sigma24 family protein